MASSLTRILSNPADMLKVGALRSQVREVARSSYDVASKRAMLTRLIERGSADLGVGLITEAELIQLADVALARHGSQLPPTSGRPAISPAFDGPAAVEAVGDVTMIRGTYINGSTVPIMTSSFAAPANALLAKGVNMQAGPVVVPNPGTVLNVNLNGAYLTGQGISTPLVPPSQAIAFNSNLEIPVVGIKLFTYMPQLNARPSIQNFTLRGTTQSMLAQAGYNPALSVGADFERNYTFQADEFGVVQAIILFSRPELTLRQPQANLVTCLIGPDIITSGAPVPKPPVTVLWSGLVDGTDNVSVTPLIPGSAGFDQDFMQLMLAQPANG